jgi:hypothetical protein
MGKACYLLLLSQYTLSISVIILQGISLLLLLTVVTFFIGSFLWKGILHKSNSEGVFLQFFKKIFLGSLLLVTFVSIIACKGQSINAGIVIIFLFFFIERKIKPPVPGERTELKQPDRFSFIILLLLLIFCFSWQAISIFLPGTFPGAEIEKEGVFYAELSRCLIESGHENTFTTANFLYKNYQSPTPYHYFDLWLNGTLSWITGFNSVYCLYLVVYPFFMLLFLAGLLAIAESYVKLNWRTVLVCIALLFVSGTRTSEYLPSTSHLSAEMLGMTERSYGGKLLPAYCVIIYFMHCFFIEKKRSSLLYLLLLPIFSISFAPGVFTGLFIFSLFKFFRSKEDKAFYFRLFLYTWLSAAFIFCFYYFTKTESLNYRFDKTLSDYSDLEKGPKFLVAELFGKSWKLPFLFMLDYFPFIPPLLFLLIENKRIRSFLVLSTLISIGGMLCFNFLYKLTDNYQFYIHTLILFHVLFSFCFLQFISNENNKVRKITVSLLFMAACSYNAYYAFSWHTSTKAAGITFSPGYLMKVSELCKQEGRTLKGAIITDTLYYEEHSNAGPLELYSFPISLAGNAHQPFNLTLPTSYKGISGFQNDILISRSPFHLYVEREKRRVHKKKEEDYQLAFIKGHHLDYVIFNKGSKRIALDNVKAAVVDELSGQEFVLLAK